MEEVYSQMKPESFRLQLQNVLTAYYEDIKGVASASGCPKAKVIKRKFEDQDDSVLAPAGGAADAAVAADAADTDAAADAAAATPATPPDVAAEAASGGEEPPPAPSPVGKGAKRAGGGGKRATGKAQT